MLPYAAQFVICVQVFALICMLRAASYELRRRTATADIFAGKCRK